jgi:hypothetical protein
MVRAIPRYQPRDFSGRTVSCIAGRYNRGFHSAQLLYEKENDGKNGWRVVQFDVFIFNIR